MGEGDEEQIVIRVCSNRGNPPRSAAHAWTWSYALTGRDGEGGSVDHLNCPDMERLRVCGGRH